MLSDTGLCDWLIISPEEDLYQCGVLACDREASIMVPWHTSGCCAMEKKTCEVRPRSHIPVSTGRQVPIIAGQSSGTQETIGLFTPPGRLAGQEFTGG